MKYVNWFFVLALAAISLLNTGCRRNPNTLWDDTKTAGRHMTRGFRSLGGKHGDSRQIRSRGEFMGDEYCEMPMAYNEQGFHPMHDNEVAMADFVSRPPRETPGDPGSSIPGIEAFVDPATVPHLSNVFRNIYFDYNSSLVKGEDSLQRVKTIAIYMKQHPQTYVFLEGHCDERGAEAFNLALGSHRSNAVRNLLIAEGVNPDHVFTISYGKERPTATGHDELSWRQNRRAEFRVYEK